MSDDRRLRRYLALAVLGFVGFLVLGVATAHGPPGRIDRSELGAYGADVSLARIATSAGRFPTYLGLCAVAIAFGLIRRAWFVRASISVCGLIVVWQTSDVAKLVFHRARPPHPILAETSFGYPSGHADLAMFFYGLWAFYLWQTQIALRVRVAIVGLLLAWIAAIGWSRLALGAHYPSDVIGGYLFGAGSLAVAIVVSIIVKERRPSVTGPKLASSL